MTPLLVTRGEELILLTKHLDLHASRATWEAASIDSSSPLSDLRGSARTVIESSPYSAGGSLAAIAAPAGFLLVYDRPTLDVEATGGVARVYFRILSVFRRRRAEGSGE